MIAGGEQAAHLRQQDGAGGDADDADRQLVHAVGVIHRRQAARRQHGSDDGIGKDGDLRPCRADDRRSQAAKEATHLRRDRWAHEAFEDAGAPRRISRHAHLEQARHQRAPARGIAGVGEQHRRTQKGDGGHVEEHGCEGGGGEITVGVERALLQRVYGDEQQVGKGDPRHRHGERELFRVGAETRREQVDDGRHQHPGERQQHDLRSQQQGEDLAGEPVRLFMPVARQDVSIGRHVGGVEGAFAEDGAEVVGQAQRHQEGVGE